MKALSYILDSAPKASGILTSKATLGIGVRVLLLIKEALEDGDKLLTMVLCESRLCFCFSLSFLHPYLLAGLPTSPAKENSASDFSHSPPDLALLSKQK